MTIGLAILFLLAEVPQSAAAQPSQWPVDDENARITGTYGDYRLFPKTGIVVFHDGIDIQKTSTPSDPAGDLINLVGVGGQVSFVPVNDQSREAKADPNRTLVIFGSDGVAYSYGHILEDENILKFDSALGLWDSLPDSNAIVGQMHPDFPVGKGSPGPHLHFRVSNTATRRPLKHPLDSTVRLQRFREFFSTPDLAIRASVPYCTHNGEPASLA